MEDRPTVSRSRLSKSRIDRAARGLESLFEGGTPTYGVDEAFDDCNPIEVAQEYLRNEGIQT